MRALVALSSLLVLACTGADHELDAAGSDGAMPDAAPTDAPVLEAGARDAGPLDAGAQDASIACSPPSAISYARALEVPPGVLGLAVASDFLAGTFEIGGTTSLVAADGTTSLQGFRVTWDDAAAAATRVRTYGPSGASGIADLAVDVHGDLTVGGTFTPPAVIERIHLDGPQGGGVVAHLAPHVAAAVTPWTSDTPTWLTAVAARGEGYVVGGSYTTSIRIGTASCDTPNGAFVAAVAFDGRLQWLRCLDGTGASVRGVVAHDAGAVYVVGQFLGTLAIDDGMLQATSVGTHAGFVARYGSTGTPLWLRSVGSSAASASEGLARVVVSGTNVLAVGTVGPGAVDVVPDAPLGAEDGVVVALDQRDGSVVGAIRVGGPSADALASIAVDRCGDAWVVGRVAGAGVVHGLDADTLALGPDLLAAMGAGVSPTGVAVTSDGARVVVVGRYDGAPSIGGSALPMADGGGLVLGVR